MINRMNILTHNSMWSLYFVKNVFNKKCWQKVDFVNVNSPIPGFSTKIVPDLHGFTKHCIFDSPKSGDFLYKVQMTIHLFFPTVGQ